MRIALLSTNYDLGGAAIVTLRLTQALRALGHDARMVVARPGASAGSAIVVPKGQWLKAFLRERAHLWLHGVPRKNLFKLSTGLWGCALEQDLFVASADAIIVNWASQGFLSLSSLKALIAIDKPIVYAMHDLWPATALCHLPGTCARYTENPLCHGCPLFSGHRKYADRLSDRIAAEKRAIFSADNLHLVAMSSWQRREALRSAILAGKEITVIPHAFPIDFFTPAPAAPDIQSPAKADGRSSAPTGTEALPPLHIVMAAARLDDPVKDLPAAVEALNILAQEQPALAARAHVDFVGTIRDTSPLSSLTIGYTLHGPLDADALRRLYRRAAVVLSSSKYETMGATLMEGMACGAIPVTFGDAGQADIVTDAVNGFIAPVHTPASLSFALQTALLTAAELREAYAESAAADNAGSTNGLAENLESFFPAALHASVAERFSPESIAARYLKLLQ